MNGLYIVLINITDRRTRRSVYKALFDVLPLTGNPYSFEILPYAHHHRQYHLKYPAIIKQY